MNKLFNENVAPFNELIKDAVRCSPGYLECIETIWEGYRHIAPPNFQKKFLKGQAEFDGSLWEMILGRKLIDQGFNLIPDNSGDGDRPDLCIEIAGKRVWIECCVPTLGNPDSENYPISPANEDGIRGVNIDALLLRCTQALKCKKAQHERWIGKGICKANEPYIIAINGHNLQFLDIDNRSMPRIMGALYGMGPLCIEWDTKSGDTRTFFKHQLMIPKSNNAEVSAGFFLDEQASNVSGIIFCTDWIHSYSSRPKPKYCYIENINAQNRVDIDFGDYMQTYLYEEDRIRMKP